MDDKDAKNEQRDRKFETLFDGDEIDGKRYPLGGGVTGLDAATAEYLVRQGRLAEVDDDEHFASLKKPGSTDSEEGSKQPPEPQETDEERATREAEEKAQQARIDAATADFDAKRIPDDLIDPAKPDSDADRLVTGAKLAELAKAAGIEAKGNKRDVAIAIMAANAKDEAEKTS